LKLDGHFKSQSGITGLETAIILIAFVVVAAIFAFTVLSTGVFASERSKETIYAGIEETKSSLSPKGATVVETGDVAGTTAVVKVTFNIAVSLSSSEIIDLSPPYTFDDTGTDPDAGTPGPAVVSYTDPSQHIVGIPWTARFLGGNNNDNLLDPGEQAEIIVWLHALNTGTGVYALGSSSDPFLEDRLVENETFTLLFDPGIGATINIERTIPVKLSPIIFLK
jgi:flagellin FlaB